MDYYRRCLRLDPNNWAAHNGMGNALQRQGVLLEALEHYQAALRLNPREASCWNNLGTALRVMGRHRESIEYFRKAIAVSPATSRAHSNLAQAERDLGNFDQALHAYQEAIQLAPNDLEPLGNLTYLMQRMCRWSGLPPRVDKILRACSAANAAGDSSMVHPLSLISLPCPSSASQQLYAARRWASTFPRDRMPGAAAPRRSKDRIRIGYLSADFYDHPVAALIPEVLELHDRQQFEVFGYSLGKPDESAIRKRISAAVDCFRDEFPPIRREQPLLLRK